MRKLLNKSFKREKGQAMVEFALVIGIFLLLSMAILDFGWIGYRYITFNYNYRVSTWNLTVDDPDIDYGYHWAEDGARYFLLEQFKKYAIGIKTSDIKINNPYISLETERKNITQPDGAVRLERRRYMNIKADISYSFPPLTPYGKFFFGDRITITKRLEKLRLLQVKH